MKSIEELNKKIWYRAIKSIYILSFISFTIFAVIGAYDANKKSITINNNKTKIICNNGRILSAGQAEVSFYDTDFNSFTNKKIQDSCQWFEGKYTQGKDSSVNFQYSESGGIKETIYYSFLYVAILLVAYEISRRVFYYIVLGSIKPPRE